MSIEQANAFRTFVNENETVQEKIREGLVKDPSFSLVEVAAEHGYAFTSEEAQTAWDEAQTGELSEFELEIVSGGASVWRWCTPSTNYFKGVKTKSVLPGNLTR